MGGLGRTIASKDSIKEMVGVGVGRGSGTAVDAEDAAENGNGLDVTRLYCCIFCCL